MKKNLIYILVGLAVVLLLINILINWTNKKPPVEKKPELKTSLVDSLFINSIQKFNLDSNWVETIAINSRQYDSLDHVYKIKLPGDLRPAIVLQQLKNDFISLPAKLISDEKIVNDYTTLNILTNNQLKLQATFTVVSELERPHSKIAYILSNFDQVDEETKELLYHSVLPFSVLLLPSLQNDSLLTGILDYKKTYSVLIDDGIDAPNYGLEKDFSKIHLKESVRYITWNYSAAELFIINEKSELFRSAIFNFIKDEFGSRDIRLYTTNDFITLPANIDEAKSLNNFYIESNVNKPGKVIILPANIFTKLEPDLLEAKMRGTRFYSPKELMQINLEMETQVK